MVINLQQRENSWVKLCPRLKNHHSSQGVRPSHHHASQGHRWCFQRPHPRQGQQPRAGGEVREERGRAFLPSCWTGDYILFEDLSWWVELIDKIFGKARDLTLFIEMIVALYDKKSWKLMVITFYYYVLISFETPVYEANLPEVVTFATREA